MHDWASANRQQILIGMLFAFGMRQLVKGLAIA